MHKNCYQCRLKSVMERSGMENFNRLFIPAGFPQYVRLATDNAPVRVRHSPFGDDMIGAI